MTTVSPLYSTTPITINPEVHEALPPRHRYVAELTGPHATYRFERKFLRTAITENVVTLPVRAGVYEVQDWVNRNRRRRYYLVTDSGYREIPPPTSWEQIQSLTLGWAEPLTPTESAVPEVAPKTSRRLNEALRMLKDARQAATDGTLDEEDLMMYLDTAIASIEGEEV